MLTTHKMVNGVIKPPLGEIQRVCLVCGHSSDDGCVDQSLCVYEDRRVQNEADKYNYVGYLRRKTDKVTDTHKFTSGATSSELKPDYTTIPTCALRREAAVFAYGTERHGRGNYKRGFTDKQFLRDRFNHALDHLFKLRDGVQGEDHLAAVRWFTAFAMEAEEAGVNWHETLRVEAPKPNEK